MLVDANLNPVSLPATINGLQYPGNIEQLFTAAELTAIGLTAVIDAGPPANTTVVSQTITSMPDGTVQMVYVTTPIVPVISLTFLQFMALFTSTEQTAIVNSTDTQVKIFTLMASGAGTIQLSNPEVIQGVNYLESSGGHRVNAPGRNFSKSTAADGNKLGPGLCFNWRHHDLSVPYPRDSSYDLDA
jgi:hypothetical protein